MVISEDTQLYLLGCDWESKCDMGFCLCLILPNETMMLVGVWDCFIICLLIAEFY
jgi:hypothetical protein